MDVIVILNLLLGLFVRFLMMLLRMIVLLSSLEVGMFDSFIEIVLFCVCFFVVLFVI